MPVYRVPIEFTYPPAGGPGVNVFHVRTTDPGVGLDDLQGAIDALHTFYVAVAPVLCRGFVGKLGPIVDMETEEAQTKDWVDIVTLSEVNTAPPALAIVVNWRTSSATRRGSGRTFLGPLHPAIAQADGTPSDSNVTLVRNAAQALVDDSTETDGWALGVWGQESKGVAEPKVLRDVISTSVRDRFAVLRSRRP